MDKLSKIVNGILFSILILSIICGVLTWIYWDSFRRDSAFIIYANFIHTNRFIDMIESFWEKGYPALCFGIFSCLLHFYALIRMALNIAYDKSKISILCYIGFSVLSLAAALFHFITPFYVLGSMN